MRRFFSEFNRRKVLRGTLAYLAVSWLLVQIASVLLPAFDFPERAIRGLICVLAFGLIVWIPFCWLYDWGPGGFYKTEVLVEGSAQKAPARQSRVFFALFVALLLAAGGLIWWQYARSPGRIGSLAVLPFQNLSNDPEQAYLVAGMHDNLITTLAQLDSLRVISKTSTLRYTETDKSMRQIAEELGVEALIETSVLKGSAKLIVNMQLIRVHPQEKHLWARAFDFPLDGDIPGLFRSLSDTVRQEIETRLGFNRLKARNANYMVDSEAYRKYLQGKFHLEELTRSGFERALDYFSQSLAIDSTYAPVYAEMANAYVYMLQMHLIEPNQAAAKIYRYNAQALALDPNLTEAYLTRALMSWFEWDFKTCRANYEKVLQENPGNALAHAFFGHLLAVLGNMDQALQHTGIAVRLDPLNDLVLSLHAAILMAADDPYRAREAVQEALRLNPGNMLSLRISESIHYANGDLQRSVGLLGLFYRDLFSEEHLLEKVFDTRGYQAALDTLLRILEAEKAPQCLFIAELHGRLENWEEAIQWIQRAYESHDSDMPYAFMGEGRKRVILSDPRIVGLAGKMQLPIAGTERE